MGLFDELLEAKPGYEQAGTPLPNLPLFGVFMIVRAVVQLFYSWLDVRQHSMYESSVPFPPTLESALERLDQAKDRCEPKQSTDSDGNAESKDSNQEADSLLEQAQEKFHKAQAYGKDKSTVNIIASLISFAIDGVFILSGGYAWQWDQSRQLVSQYGLDDSDDIIVTLLWLGGLVLFDHLYKLPISLYRTFVIEERHGFNKQTLATFVTDLLKELMLTALIGGPVIAALIKVIIWGGTHFYLYVYALLLVVQLTMLLLYPSLIAPLFNKFTPLEDGPLRTDIQALADSLQFPLKKLFLMDASKRSGHSNAYYYGFGNNKRIVLFDTLLQQQTNEEVVAVLAHELGHWKRSHPLKMLAISQVQMFVTFLLFSKVVQSPSLYHSFGFREFPVMVGLMLFNELVYTPLGPLLSLGVNVISRKFEFQADAFACSLGKSDPLQTGLVKLHLENLGSLAVDPLYSTFHYSHPPLVERLAAMELRQQSAKTINAAGKAKAATNKKRD